MIFNLQSCLILSAALFAIGAYGVIARRNMVVMLLSVEIMLNAANLALAAFAKFHGGALVSQAQILILMNMAIAAAEIAVGLGLLIAVFRNRKSVDSARLDLMKW